MKIISDISLKDFGFWSGAKDTAEQLTDEQFDQVEAVLEDLYPDGVTDTELNDIFWFEPNKIYEWAGCFPKFFKLTATCGRVKYVRAEDSDDVDEVEGSYCDSEELKKMSVKTLRMLAMSNLMTFLIPTISQSKVVLQSMNLSFIAWAMKLLMI